MRLPAAADQLTPRTPVTRTGRYGAGNQSDCSADTWMVAVTVLVGPPSAGSASGPLSAAGRPLLTGRYVSSSDHPLPLNVLSAVMRRYDGCVVSTVNTSCWLSWRRRE